MIPFRVYYKFWSYNQVENTLHPLRDVGEFEVVDVGRVTFNAQDVVKADNWRTGTVLIQLANPKFDLPPDVAAETIYGSIDEPLPLGWGKFAKIMSGCESSLGPNEVGLLEIVITMRAKPLNDSLEQPDSWSVHTYEEFFGHNAPPFEGDIESLENETAVFGGFAYVKDIEWDESKQVVTIKAAGYDGFGKNIPASVIEIGAFKSLEEYIAHIKTKIPWLSDATITPNPDYKPPVLRGRWLRKLGDSSHWGTPDNASGKKFDECARTGRQRWLYGLRGGKYAMQFNLEGVSDVCGIDGFRVWDPAMGYRCATTDERNKFLTPGGTIDYISGFFAPVWARIPYPLYDWDKMPWYPSGWWPGGTETDGPVWGAGFCWFTHGLINSPTTAEGLLLRIQDEDENNNPCFIQTYSFDGSNYGGEASSTPFWGPAASEENPYIVHWFSGLDRFVIVSPNRDRLWLYPGTYRAASNPYAGANDWNKQPEEITDLTTGLKNIAVIPAGYNKIRVFGEKDGKYYRVDIQWTPTAPVRTIIDELKLSDVKLPSRMVVIGSDESPEIWYYDDGEKALICRDGFNLELKYLYKFGVEMDFVALGASGDVGNLTQLFVVVNACDGEPLPVQDLLVLDHGGNNPADLLPQLPDKDTIGEVLDALAHSFGCFWAITPQKKLLFKPKFTGEERKQSPWVIFSSGSAVSTSLAKKSIKWRVYGHYSDKIVVKSRWGQMGEKGKGKIYPMEIDVKDVYHNTDLGKLYATMLFDFYGRHRREAELTVHAFYDELMNIVPLLAGKWFLVDMRIHIANAFTQLKLIEKLNCDTMADIIQVLPCLAEAVEWSKEMQGWSPVQNPASLECYCPACASWWQDMMRYICNMLNNGYCDDTGQHLNRFPENGDVQMFLLEHLDHYAVFRLSMAFVCGWTRGTLREVIEQYLQCKGENCE